MLLDIIASFAIALLSGLGIGSGGLLVICLTLYAGMPQLRAQGINLVFFLFSAGASMLAHLSHRKLIAPLCILLIVSGLPGALLGATLASVLPAALLRKLFGAFLISAGVLTLTKRDKKCAAFGVFHKDIHNNG
ncbi:MAG: sulfite exporter TauE/SafE family protein [Clostridia bacterium]|nr:sulfite exporter TauE/SafE family protein [Clostridia bacterium]